MRKYKCKRRTRLWTQRLGIAGLATLILLLPMIKLHTVRQETEDLSVCAKLAPIPEPPFPSSDQQFAIAYTNDILQQIREGLGCG